MPPFGSFRDRLLEEMSYRQRVQRFVELSTFVNVLAAGMGVKAEFVKVYLELIETTLNHRAYLPGVLEKLAVNERTWTREEEMAALQEVAKWEPK